MLQDRAVDNTRKLVAVVAPLEINAAAVAALQQTQGGSGNKGPLWSQQQPTTMPFSLNPMQKHGQVEQELRSSCRLEVRGLVHAR
mmetsp:Transcript_8976/g.19390  ORF Transcript_8976/g.19390 Transcript_8976/m.19390 type:complete len:85 (+) Transcript_8976:313-567(+)